jgi:hypothetical protein
MRVNELARERNEHRCSRRNRGLPTLEASGESNYGFREERVTREEALSTSKIHNVIAEGSYKLREITPGAGEH